MQANIQQQLGKALKSINKQYAGLVTDSMTEVKIHDAPFLKRYQIYRVEHFNPHKPILFYVGFAPKQQAYLLTGTPENYLKLGLADGVVIDSPEIAANYAATYLEVTRSMSKLFYLVQSVDEVKFRPNLTDDRVKAKTSFIEQYRPVITPPTAELADHNYTVTAYAIREHTLERHSLMVNTEGNIKDDITILEQDLPLVYGL